MQKNETYAKLQFTVNCNMQLHAATVI